MISLQPYFNHKDSLLIGRDEQTNDIVLDNTLVSRQHCTIFKNTDNNYTLKDNSKNGTFINGKLIKNTEVLLLGNEQIVIGNILLYIHNPIINDSAIELINLEKKFEGNIAIHSLSLAIKKGEFVAVMGPTGCGKSTLIKCLNGTLKINNGDVNIFGLNLKKNFPVLKSLIGYVPQDDIVNKELTVNNSIYYAAKLRLAKSLTEEKISLIIDTALNAVNLNVESIRKTTVARLSGGQRKRLCIAIELLSSPKILYLDEPTSPLDPETIEDFLQCLKNLTLKGTTIVMVTHKPDDLLFTDKVIWMGDGGYTVYFGNTKDYFSLFKIQRNTELYAKLKNKDEAANLYSVFNLDNEYKSTKQTGFVANIEYPKQNPNYFHQFVILTLRNFLIKWSDKKNLIIQLGQAPLIGFLLSIIFFNGITLGFLFMLSVSVIWFGVANSSKEIVDENTIYKRERQFNLKVMPYLFSKVVVIGSIGFLQILLLLITVFLSLSVLNVQNITTFLVLFSVLIVIYCASSLMGLLLSAIVNTTEKAMTIQPLMLIPQILLAGVIYPLKAGNTLVAFSSIFTVSRWGTLAATHEQLAINPLNNLPQKAQDLLTMPDNFNLWKSVGSVFFSQQAYFGIANIILIGIMLFVATYIAMLKKDKLK